MSATFTASAKFVAIDKVSMVMQKMTLSAKQFANKTQVAFARLERQMRKLSNAVGGLGLVMGGALLIRAVTSMTGVFMDFEQANASLASVMATATQPQLQALQLDAKRLGAITAKSATEVVGLQESLARLGFGATDVVNMTQSIINGSVAMKGELADTAELVGAMVSSFDDFKSANAPGIVDQLTRSTQQSALNFEKLQTALPIVAGAANAAKVPFNNLLASLGKLSDAGIDASSSSTALRNIFLEAAKRGVNYQVLLDKVKNSTDQLATANALFGKRGAVAAVILAKNTDKVTALSQALLKGAGAQEAADKQLNTLKGRLTILNSAWEGFVLSIEDGNGKLGEFLKTTVEVVTEILSLASGTEKAKDQMSEAELRIRKLAERSIMFLKVIKWVVIALTALKAILIANKIILAVSKAAIIGHSIVMGAAAMAAKGFAIAMRLVSVVLKATPIGWLIVGIGLLVSIIASLVRNWELVKASFKEGGILKGLLTIGKVILDAILSPVQQLLELLGNIPGLDIASTGAAKIEAFRGRLFEQERALIPPEKKGELQTTQTTAAQETIIRNEDIQKQTAELNINNNSGYDATLVNPGGAQIQLSSTN